MRVITCRQPFWHSNALTDKWVHPRAYPRVAGAVAQSNNMPGHNTSLFILGVMILWFGWYGFNPGSQQGITNGQSMAVATAAIATTLAAGSGGISALVTRAIVSKVTTGARCDS